MENCGVERNNYMNEKNAVKITNIISVLFAIFVLLLFNEASRTKAYAEESSESESQHMEAIFFTTDPSSRLIIGDFSVDTQENARKGHFIGEGDDWYYYEGDKIILNKTGIVENDAGMWYVTNGKLDFSKNGIVSDSGLEYIVRNGYVPAEFYGIKELEDGTWAYVEAGVFTYEYTGLAKNEGEWWFVEEGIVDFEYTGIGSCETGDYRVENGQVDLTYNGWFNSDEDWYYMKDGMVDTEKTGLQAFEGTYCYLVAGKVDFGFTGHVDLDGYKYYVKSGIADLNYTEDGNIIPAHDFLFKHKYYSLEGFEDYCLNQDDLGLPTGCEMTSFTMACNYKGHNVDIYEAIDTYLPQGEIAASNPYEVFVGSPYDSGSYGCYAQVITNVAGAMGIDHINYSETSFQNLIDELEAGRPVIFWATMDMVPTIFGSSEWYCPDGTYISWRGCEHCLVLVGYDLIENVFYFADPLKGYICSYNIGVSLARWDEQGYQAVVIY